MKLTEQQIRYFETFGFLVFRGLFADKVDRITNEFERTHAEFSEDNDFKNRTECVPFIDSNEYLSALIDDPILDGMAISLMGDDYNYHTSDGNYYVGDTQWHSDRYRPQPVLTLKAAFYLDPVDRDSGCLRVIPGSHRFGDTFGDLLQEVVQDSRKEQCEKLWGVCGSEVPAVALESKPGDVLVFNHRTKHSSWGGSTHRRMFTINYAGRYADDDIHWLQDELERTAAAYNLSVAYGPVMTATAGPDRMRHLEQHIANEYVMPAAAARGTSA